MYIPPVHSEGDQLWDFFGRNDAKAEAPVLWPPHAKSWLIWKDPDAGKDWGQEEKGMTEDEMAGWHHWLNGNGFGWTPGVGDGQGGLACYGSWDRKESDVTELSCPPFPPSVGWGGVLPWVLSSDRHRRLVFVLRHVELCFSIGHLHPFPAFSLGCHLILFWMAWSTMVASFISILLSLKCPSLAVILQIQPPLWHLLWPLNVYSEAELVFYASAIYNLVCSSVIICLCV